MAQKNFKVNEPIEVLYQALNAKTAATVQMEVYDESHAKVLGGPTQLTELGTTGRYYGSFTPIAEGSWSVQLQESDGSGKVAKTFSVGANNLQDVGAKADAIEGKVDAVDTKIDSTSVKVDAVDAKIIDLDSDVVTLDGKVSTIDTKMDSVDAKVDGLATDVASLSDNVAGLSSPPMIG